MTSCVLAKSRKISFTSGDALSFETVQVLDEQGRCLTGTELPNIDKRLALKIYDACVFTRVLDKRMLAAQRQGRISFYLTCTGEEAAVIGSAAALNQSDMIMAQYREQAALRFRGFSTDQFMNQLFGNQLDPSQGRQMPIHYGSKALNYLTVSSPLATQIPQAAGYGYGQKLSGEKHCTLCYFGEGAASEGDFHAGLNMASVMGAPVIFFCRNNEYAISTKSEDQYSGDGIAARGVGYGVPSLRVDGNDMLAVLAVTQMARDYVIEQQKPVLIEAMTYRLGAHSSSDDPTGYRTKEEEEQWQSRDPIVRYKHWLLRQGWWSEEQDRRLTQQYQQEILAALKKAEVLPKPDLDSLITDVYDQPPALLIKQLAQIRADGSADSGSDTAL